MPKTLGLVADPVVVAETAEQIGPAVANRLSGDWHVRLDQQDFPAGQELSELSGRAKQLAGDHGWDAVIGLTDLPIVVDGRIVLADLSPEERVAMLSVPALGPLTLGRRLRSAVVRVADALEDGDHRRVVPIDRGGHARLVLGMVAANHPVRLVRHLTSAGAAALGTTAIALMNSSVWLLTDHLAPPRIAAALLLSIAIMVGWLIVRYDLWEPAEEEEGILPAGRKRAALFNAATVLTLAAGVIALYAVLLAVALASAALVIADGAVASTVGHGVSTGFYLKLAVFATSIGLVGGALGSGFESQEAVRRVAFGVRERHRRDEAPAKSG